MTTKIAEVLKLAAKPVRYDNDERTLLKLRFKLQNYLTLVDEKYVQLLHDAESQPVANSSRRRRTCSDRPNAESHAVRLAGDTDHLTKSETGAKSAEQKRVRGVATVGGRECAKDRGSKIRDAASRATARNERQSGKVRGQVENVGTPGGCLRKPCFDKAG